MVNYFYVEGVISLYRYMFVGAAVIMSVATAEAATVKPIEYSMIQGGVGSDFPPDISYRDNIYTGSNSDFQSGAPVAIDAYGYLSGGLGKLTDGVIATKNARSIVEDEHGNRLPDSYDQLDRYVGWSTQQISQFYGDDVHPVISWKFDQEYEFNSVTFHFSRADLGHSAGLRLPSKIGVKTDGSDDEYVVDPAYTTWNGAEKQGLPVAYTLDLSMYGPMSSFDTTIFHAGSWVMISEVTFDANVPLPASGLLLFGGLGALGLLRRRRKA